jgi:phosphoglycolate phosphatase
VIPPFSLYLFDIDGTLVDSVADISGAIRETLAPTEAPPLSDDYLRVFIGHHLRDMFQEVLPHYSPEQIEELIKTYRRIYPARRHASTRVYPGVPEMLSALGGKKSTATTKGTEMARSVLTQFNLARFFDHVQGTDGFPAKPQPDVILKSLEFFGAAPEECLLIGDSGPDMEAGRRAGVKTCAVSYGYGDLDAMRRHQPDYWISAPSELCS